MNGQLQTNLLIAALNVVENAQFTFRSRNGEQRYIQMDDGEAGILVHSDYLKELEKAAQDLMEAPVPDEEIEKAIRDARIMKISSRRCIKLAQLEADSTPDCGFNKT